MTAPKRKWMLHDTPSWVDPDDSDFFITICCQQRGTNQLCLAPVGDTLLEATRFYHAQQKWFPFLFILMPDHVHMLARFGRDYEMIETVSTWKRYTSRKHRIVWQRNFFEHRLRSDENIERKADYIQQNPVRAGLVAKEEDWPWVLMLD